jgi:predicted lipoprotein
MNLKANHPVRRRSEFLAGLALLAMAPAMWKFPLVHVSRLDAKRSIQSVEGDFNAIAAAETLWYARLQPAFGKAPDAKEVLDALRANPTDACSRFGHKVGINRNCLYMLQGTGVIVSLKKNVVGISLTPGGAHELLISTGLLFGNAVRDAAGLVEASDFADSQDFNALSEQLNRLVESRVLADFRKRAAVGQRIRFAGCVEVKPSWNSDKPLAIIPVRIEID